MFIAIGCDDEEVLAAYPYVNLPKVQGWNQNESMYQKEIMAKIVAIMMNNVY